MFCVWLCHCWYILLLTCLGLYTSNASCAHISTPLSTHPHTHIYTLDTHYPPTHTSVPPPQHTGMSGMANCTAFYKMCSTKDAQSAFPTICDNGQGGSGGGGSDPEYIPPMTMWFHQRVQEVILFVEWIPRTTAAYVGSWFAVFFISVTTQALKVGRMGVVGRGCIGGLLCGIG